MNFPPPCHATRGYGFDCWHYALIGTLSKPKGIFSTTDTYCYSCKACGLLVIDRLKHDDACVKKENESDQ